VKEVIAAYIGFEVLYFRWDNFCNIVLTLVNTTTMMTTTKTQTTTTTTKYVPCNMIEKKRVH